ncbi:MAG: hypothetical protein KDC66_14530, partial [Phaeodactylibacter sp.]|nr:hypothetical protein [Phaeodactylibacter sp.]MCB0570987.1 hypothetical protein [Phaeodactylibacter sp.]
QLQRRGTGRKQWFSSISCGEPKVAPPGARHKISVEAAPTKAFRAFRYGIYARLGAFMPYLTAR